MPPTDDVLANDSDPTRLRLLDAAGETFANEGFRAATVRDICRRAGANIAAVTYHFGGKEALYHATLLHWVEAAAERHPIEPEPDAPPQRRLDLFVAAMFGRLLDEGKPAWHGRLMARELAEPTSYSDEHVRRFVRPTMSVLDRIVADWLGAADPGDRPHLRRRMAYSVMGQVLFYWHARHLMPRVHPCAPLDAAEVGRAARHAARVSAAALDAARDGGWGDED